MDLENKNTEIMHLRKLLNAEIEKKTKLQKELTDWKDAYLTIDKKYYPGNVKFYSKAKLFEIRKEDGFEDVWDAYCSDLDVDEGQQSFCVCVIGTMDQYDS